MLVCYNQQDDGVCTEKYLLQYIPGIVLSLYNTPHITHVSGYYVGVLDPTTNKMRCRYEKYLSIIPYSTVTSITHLIIDPETCVIMLVC